MCKRKFFQLLLLALLMFAASFFSSCKNEGPKNTAAEATSGVSAQSTPSASGSTQPDITSAPVITTVVTSVTVTTTVKESEDTKMPVSCEFKNMTPDEFNKIFSIKDEEKSKWKLGSEDGLVITSIRGELFQSDNDCKNIFLQN